MEIQKSVSKMKSLNLAVVLIVFIWQFNQQFCNVQLLNNFQLRSLISPNYSHLICLGIQGSCCSQQSFVKIKRNVKRNSQLLDRQRKVLIQKVDLIQNKLDSNVIQLQNFISQSKQNNCNQQFQSLKATWLLDFSKVQVLINNLYSQQQNNLTKKQCAFCDHSNLTFLDFSKRQITVNFQQCQKHLLDNNSLYQFLFIDLYDYVQQMIKTSSCLIQSQTLKNLEILLGNLKQFSQVKECFTIDKPLDFQNKKQCQQLCQLFNIGDTLVFTKQQIDYLQSLLNIISQIGFINFEKQNKNQKSDIQQDDSFEIQLQTSENIQIAQDKKVMRILAQNENPQSKLETYYQKYYDSLFININNSSNMLSIFSNRQNYDLRNFQMIFQSDSGIIIDKYTLNNQKRNFKSSKNLIFFQYSKRSKENFK